MKRVFAGGLLVFAIVLVINAWVVDDAYITLRTVDNFVHGYGLRWNVDERVQAYTHPLWLFMLTPFYLLTHEAFFTSIAVSLAFSLAAVVIAAWSVTEGFRERVWRAPLLLLALLASKAVIDYTSSGLENPLAYLLVALLCAVFLTRRDASSQIGAGPLLAVGLVASAAFLTHPDLVLLFAPAVVVALLTRPRRHWPGTVGLLVAAALPAALWILFSVVYYGFPFPNTAYAKALDTGIPLSWKITRGVEYLTNSIRLDAASYAMAVAALTVAIATRRWRALVLLSGVALELIFVLVVGAAGTHMGGRFVSVPLFMAIVVFVSMVESRRTAAVTAVALLLFMLTSPVSALKFGTSAYQRLWSSDSYIDAKRFVYEEGAALLDWRPGTPMPDHMWFHEGERLRAAPEKVYVGGPLGGVAIGYFGFAAGPHKFIVDRMALSDPLLARLAAVVPSTTSGWKSGHFARAIPDGYVASVASNRNMLTDPRLHRCYDAIRDVTRGPLFTGARWRAIWDLNTRGCE